jgi:D-arabinose 1-dehydrogenase-like Zn-dependent alcohol dehydrogenase
MKALTFKRYGKSPEIGLADVPRPTPKPDELLVQVHAVGLNPIDNMIPQGTFKPVLHFQLPATLGSDLAGVVVEVGSRVTRFKPGDAVFASLFDLGTGSLAEFAVVPESAAASKPSNLDFVQAASVPMVALTSWQALKERTGLRRGQKVFTNALRNELAAQQTQVLGLHMAYVDTDLTRGLDAPKSSPEQIVQRALDGLESGLDEVLADELTQQVKRGMTAPRPSYLPQRA